MKTKAQQQLQILLNRKAISSITTIEPQTPYTDEHSSFKCPIVGKTIIFEDSGLYVNSNCGKYRKNGRCNATGDYCKSLSPGNSLD
jgi:hypothetical protein